MKLMGSKPMAAPLSVVAIGAGVNGEHESAEQDGVREDGDRIDPAPFRRLAHEDSR